MASAKKSTIKAQKGKKSPPPARKPAPKKAAPKPAARKAAPPKKPAPKPAAKPVKKAAKPAPAKAAPKVVPKPAPKAPAKPVKAAPKPPAKPAPKPAPSSAKAPPPAPKAAAPAKPAPPAVKAPAPKAAPPAKPAPAAKAPAPAKPAAPPPAPAPAAAPAASAPAAKTAAPAAGAKAAKKKPIPTTSLAATPVIRPFSADTHTLAPPPPPAKPGHVDHQVLSAISYGLFAAINKTFGFAGQSVVKNASLRVLEYGYKRGWLPPKSKEPVRALNEFLGRLETMGYAEKIHVGKRGDAYALEVSGLADFDAVHSLREMHYPLLPIFLGEMVQAILDQYFQLKVTMSPLEMAEQRRGFTLPFTIHERTVAAPDTSRMVSSYSRLDEFEE